MAGEIGIGELELAKRHLVSQGVPATRSDIAARAKALARFFRGLVVGREYVYLDGACLEADSRRIKFKGLHRRHDLDVVPQLAIRDGLPYKESFLSDPDYYYYWNQQET